MKSWRSSAASMPSAEKCAGKSGTITFGIRSSREIRVGDGGLRAAATIADRPRLGACALRADLQGADIVDPGDAAPARADFDDVDHRHHHRVAARVTAHVVARGHGGLAIAYEAR